MTNGDAASGTHERPSAPATDWRLAACRPYPTDWWFPQPGEGITWQRGICAGCAVRAACLVGAVARNEQHGIWAGAGEGERRVLRKAYKSGTYELVAAAHFRALDGKSEPGDFDLLNPTSRNATHGRRVTYARGCRCQACSLSTALGDDVLALLPARTKSTTPKEQAS